MARKKRKSRGLGEVTKRDFVAIANVLCETGASESTARGMARYFQSQNSRFDADRFVSATRSCRR